MPYRNVEFRAGEYYHLYNRGNNFQPIFFERDNYLYFLRLLRKYLVFEAIEIVVYCLMPNHYHLLVYLNTDDLSSLMQPFALAYTKAINNLCFDFIIPHKIKTKNTTTELARYFKDDSRLSM